MADSYHIIDGKVVPYSGGRKCNDTDAWRDATPLELQLQEQLAEYEHATAAKDAEIEALRAEVREAREFRDKMANAIGNDQLRRFIEKHGEPVPLTTRMQEAEARADKLRAEVERLTLEMERLQQQYDERTACMIVHRGSALACSAAVRAAYSEEHERAERLAEALRWAERHCPCGARPESPDTHPHVPGCLVGAALAQEARND